jgi:hypothetical protein
MTQNGTGTTTLDPALVRLIDEHILAMRKILEERLVLALADYQRKVDARLDQLAVDLEDALDTDDPDEDEPDEDEDGPSEFEERRRR